MSDVVMYRLAARRWRRMGRPYGFTVVELLIALMVGGVVAASLVGVLRRQQRFYVDAGVLLANRVALRDATGIIPGELRSLAPAAGDVIAFSDSSLEIRASIGAAVACDTVAGGDAIHLAPAPSPGVVMSPILSAFTTAPEPGDLLLAYDAGPDDGARDDTWAALSVTDVSLGSGLCDASPFARSIPRESATVRLRFGAGERVPPTVHPGAFVRVLRRVRYRFYRSGTGEWFLGYAEWNGAGFAAVQPVSGPFAPYQARGTSGLRLRYFDAAGAALTTSDDPARIARVEVTARSATDRGLSGTGGIRPDSQTVTIRVRNQ